MCRVFKCRLILSVLMRIFAADTAKMEEHLNALQKKYPSFLTDYLYNILAVPPPARQRRCQSKMFLRDYW